jgi:hypothetical protein
MALDQAATAFRQILPGFVSLPDFLIVPEGKGFGEFLRALDFVELFLNRLTQGLIINIPE